jgi:aquaporin Z
MLSCYSKLWQKERALFVSMSDKTNTSPAAPLLSQCLVAEFCGTFGLVFIGTGALVVNEMTGGEITHVGVSLTFGLAVLAMIYAFGDVSGCHINPAVTAGFWASGRFDGRRVPGYIVAQCAGALTASGAVRMLFPTAESLGGTVPSGSSSQTFVLELILTMLLMLVILSVSFGSKETGLLAGVAVGSVIAFESLFAGPVSGASMNPARSLGPAIIAGETGSLWVYLVAPILGAVLSVPLYRVIHLHHAT